jgi:hypothetical protein
MVGVQNQEITNKSLVTKVLAHISFVLRNLILKDYSLCIIRLSQKSYINKVESKFDMKVCKLMDVLIIKEDYLVSIIVQKKIWKFRK